VGRVPGFAGFTGNGSSSGGNGVSLVDDASELWSSEGDSTVKVIDLKTNKIVDTISTGGEKRAS
jgi:DNA-binding beta-propeller fold protein YncE